ncbi:MAG: hypothetical protein K0U86_20880 [Planctomycetes bacterium]|nr:hypothetical protein [Planctomycetota bacterium]MCH9776636.1 hypothetical protein [Planctomycetota bacterium]
MILLFWFSVCTFLMAAGADPLRLFITGAGFVLVVDLTVNDFVERRGDVNPLLVREPWLIAVDRWLNGGSNVSKRVRNASISYETLGTGGDLSGEDFQNRGTFMVARSSVFSKSSVHKSHLSRARRL